MTSLYEEINQALSSGQDVTAKLGGRHYRQIGQLGYVGFMSYNPDKKKVALRITEEDGDIRFMDLDIEDTARYKVRIEGEPEILPRSNELPFNSRSRHFAVDIGD